MSGMVRVDGVRVNLDRTEKADIAGLYEAMGRGDEVTGLAIGVEQDDVHGESVVVSLPGVGQQVKCLVPGDEVGEPKPKVLSWLVGTELTCQVVHIDRARGMAVLSRKVVQERHSGEVWGVLQEQAERLGALREAVRAARQELARVQKGGSREAYLAALDRVRTAERAWHEGGPEFDAVVRMVFAEGALLDIGGGVLARLPVGEVEHGYLADCRERLKPGYGFRVKVLVVEPERRRVLASRRALLPDPWAQVERQYRAGGIYLGRVAAVHEDRVRVELRPGVSVVVDRYAGGGPEGGQRVAAALGPAPGAQVLVSVRKVVPEVRRMYGRLLRVLEQPA